MARTAFLALALPLILVGCGGGEDRALLLDWVFDSQTADTLATAAALHHEGMQVMARGWMTPGARGIWTTGDEAVVRLVLHAQDAEIEITCATSREIAARGQSCAVLFNGRPVGRLDFARGWERQTVRLPVAKEMLHQGANVLALRPAITGLEADAQEGMGVFVYRLRVTGTVGGGDRRRLAIAGGQPVARTIYRQEAAGRTDDTGGVRPDLLVILLDAARADHFGCYGYDRATTPFIDGLADEGVVYRQVMAAAPYTLCSVPTIFTGRSWLEHDVMEPGDVLPVQFPTLAGVLRAAGYATLAYSENPYVSAATGLDRGFDAFHENWSDGEQGSVPVADLLAQDLPHLPAERPAFCYVHLLPPHAPYDPSPGHDIFTEPGYGGPATGNFGYLDAIDLGTATWTEEDRRHLLGLYDGNLHMADAWAARIVEAWRRVRPGRETLIVVLSDHGEAFAEHGRFLHNSTLYPEMMHVPLVLHPARLAAGLPEPGDLRSLADVMPMILAALDVGIPGDAAWPRHFLEVIRGQAGPRAMIAEHAAGDRPLGLRTPAFHAIFGDRRHQEFYDVRSDPAQRHDLRLVRDPDYAPLVGTLLGLLEFKQEHGIDAERGSFSDADADRLKALGY